MSCHGCAKKFGILLKERGCPGCGFSYCTKCLNYKRVLPKLGSEAKTVCRFCFIAVPGEKKADVIDPPDAYLKRLDALENPAKPPIVVYKTDKRMEQLKTGLAEADRKIVDRLEKLREDQKKPIPTEQEIRNRLAALKDATGNLESSLVAKKPAVTAYLVSDTRTEEEKAMDLMKQYVEEQELEAKREAPEEEIARRLARLRKKKTDPKGDKPHSQEKDSDESNGSDREANKMADVVLAAASKKHKKKLRATLPSEGSEMDAQKLAELKTRFDALGIDLPSSDEEVSSEELASSGEELKESDISTDEEKVDDPSLCWLCQRLEPTITCTNCKLAYCDNCRTSFHSISEYSHHKYIPFESTELAAKQKHHSK